MYDFLLYLIPQVAKFPKGQRYLLGERLESVAFDVLELLLAACKAQRSKRFKTPTTVSITIF